LKPFFNCPEKVFFIEFGAPVFYNSTDAGDPNSVGQGPAVAVVVRVGSFLHKLNHCVAILMIFLLLIGLIAAPGYAESGVVQGKHLSGQSPLQPAAVNSADQPLIVNHPLAMPWLAQSEYPMLDQNASAENRKSEKKHATVEPITRWVPIWGEQVREKGYDLPLPFGLGVNLVLMDQGIDVKNLKIGFSAPNAEVSSVTFSNARARDNAFTARMDMWLLPFLNIYGIYGYINGEAELDVNIPAISVDLPIIGTIPITEAQTVNLDIDYEGSTYGGGMTLAGGYKNFFGSLDANYTYSDIDVANSEIETYTISPRLGILLDPKAIKGSLAFWVGAMYMDYEQTVTDTIDLSTVSALFPSVELDFEIDIKNDHPWNFLFGGQWELTKRWQFVAEGGMGDRKHLITGLFFRF